jgi:heat shock protein HslJ
VGRARRQARPLLALALATLALGACSGGDELDGTSWEAVQLGARPTVPDVVSTATFADGEVSGSGGCNSYTAEYRAGGSAGLYGGADEPTSISITNVGGTELACEELVMAQESSFYDALTTAETYRVVTDRLELLDGGGEVLLAFVRTGD